MDAIAYRRAGLLRYAALQFLALVGAAMLVYAGGSYWHPDAPDYAFTGNFLSDLGMTHAWSGRTNYASAALFCVALASVGIATILFSWSWRRFAFARQRARFAGYASLAFGTLSGLGFMGVAFTPFDLALRWHNLFVLSAFGFLLFYVIALTVVMARNGAPAVQNAINLAYVAIVMGYVALIFLGPRLDTEQGQHVQVIGQKLVAIGSMLHVTALATSLRRRYTVPT